MGADARHRGFGPHEIGAGFGIALLAFVAAVWDATGRPTATELAACPEPREWAADEGHTRHVRCDGVGRAVRGPTRVLYELGIDPNRADAATLEALPGIGPARAAAVVAGRADAPYTHPRDLLRVHGIGPVTLRRAADWLTFPPPRTGSGGLP